MSYGIVVRNSQGGIQIDGDYQNLSLQGSGQQSSSARAPGCGDKLAYIPWNFSEHPEAILCVRPRGSGKVYTLFGEPANNRFVVGFKGGSNYIDYAVYAARKNSPDYSTNYGFQVFDSAGSVVFDSRERYLSVLGFVDLYIPPGEDLGEPSVTTANNPYASHSPYIMQPPGFCESVPVAPGTRTYLETWVGFGSNGQIVVENYTQESISDFRVFLVEPPF
jgi:hypothetical protein